TATLTYTGSQDALNAALATIVYNPDLHYRGTDTLTLTVSDFGPPELGGLGTATASLTVTVIPRAEPPDVSAADARGVEGSPVPLSLSAALSDPHPGETLSVRISGVPLSARLSAGVDLGGGDWALTPAQLDGLTLVPTDDFTVVLTLSATATLPDNNT